VFGILTTMKGWCISYRVNGGGLYITRMFGDFAVFQGTSEGAALEGYHPAQSFSIMQALYFMCSLAEATNDVPEISMKGIPGQVRLPLLRVVQMFLR